MGLLSRADYVQQDPAPKPAPRKAAARAAGARKATPGPAAVCPVVARPVCYYGDCHYWSGDRCGHPQAAAEAGPRRPRARRAAPRAVAAAPG